MSLALDAGEDQVEALATLETLATLDDEASFVWAANRIDWSQRPAADFVRGVYLSLSAGAHWFARHLAARGARQYPNHHELQNAARILAPPRVVRTGVPPDQSLEANQAWLHAHAREYRGQWVALHKGRLVAASATPHELRSCLESTNGVLITKIS